MQELRLVGSSDDGAAVLLVDDSGSTYRLSVDDRLRVLVRRPTAPAGSRGAGGQTGAPLPPREIQARIRAGENAEEVAAATGLPVERVRRYEGPVLAERAHVAATAQRCGVRRSSGEAGSLDGQLQLGEAAQGRLDSRGVRADEVTWDAWRREDGRWTVRADFPATEGHASGEFVFDLMSRYSVPSGDGARWLLGEQPAPPEQVRQFVPRLAAVGAEDAWQERSEHPALSHRAQHPALSHRADRADPSSRPAQPPRAAQPPPKPPTPRPLPAPAAPAAREAAAAEADSPVAPMEQPDTGSGEQLPAPSAPAGGSTPADGSGSGNAVAARTGRRKRAAVPAWDDILFGGRPAE